MKLKHLRVVGPGLYLRVQKAEAGRWLFCSQPEVCNKLKVNCLVDLVSPKKKKKKHLEKPKKNLMVWDGPAGSNLDSHREAKAESQAHL